ncbi:hypothetical protein L6452_26877 [Arctium lappa]|uniref:Uncharacterized protein n=1 Tax=Arctium lappa TaxID=4217 RepID=A0ACB8ZVE7_ARCLA|nr:hypothetical protein L6452_26877 [Arctium lappa]
MSPAKDPALVTLGKDEESIISGRTTHVHGGDEASPTHLTKPKFKSANERRVEDVGVQETNEGGMGQYSEFGLNSNVGPNLEGGPSTKIIYVGELGSPHSGDNNPNLEINQQINEIDKVEAETTGSIQSQNMEFVGTTQEIRSIGEGEIGVGKNIHSMFDKEDAGGVIREKKKVKRGLGGDRTKSKKGREGVLEGGR